MCIFDMANLYQTSIKNGSSCLACTGMELMIFTKLSIVYMHYSIVSIVDQLSESKKGSDFLC